MTYLGGGERAIGRPCTFLNIVLDASGSMESVSAATIRAFNEFLQQQKDTQATAHDEVYVSLTTFSDKVKTVFVLRPLPDVGPLTPRHYTPDGGTALFDGIAESVAVMEREVGPHARVLTLVITDGEENASKRVTDIRVLRELIQQREARGNWTFVFLSAGPNPFATASAMGFRPGNVQSYGQPDVGPALVRSARAVTSYRQGDHLQTGTFWAGEAPRHERTQWTQEGIADVEDVV